MGARLGQERQAPLGGAGPGHGAGSCASRRWSIHRSAFQDVAEARAAHERLIRRLARVRPAGGRDG